MHRRFKAKKRKWLKAKNKKSLENKLLAMGQTKHLYQLRKKGQAELKAALKRKNVKSIENSGKTTQFFKNLQVRWAWLNNWVEIDGGCGEGQGGKAETKSKAS